MGHYKDWKEKTDKWDAESKGRRDDRKAEKADKAKRWEKVDAGDNIRTSVPSDKYRDNYEKVFGHK